LNSLGSLIGGIFVLLITFQLINSIGIKAAAIGQLIGFITSFFVTMYYAQRNIKIQYSSKTIAIMMIVSLSLLCIKF